MKQGNLLVVLGVLLVGGALLVGLVALAGASAFVSLNSGNSGNKQPETVVEGDTEFVITYYDPGQGGINGSNCGGSHGRICLKGGSPTGYEVTEDSTGKKFTGAGAIPQPGSVDWDQVPVPYDHGRTTTKGIVIPCYNNDKPFLPLDHFAPSITKANRLDLAMTGEANGRFLQCLKERKIKTSSGGGGFNGGTVINGKVVDIQ